MIKNLFLFLAIICALGMQAADFPMQFEHLGLEDGLPGKQVQCLLEDEFGKLWIGTTSGMAHYNGKEISLMNTRDSLQAILSESYILSFYQKAYGDIWITTFGNGLFRYDVETGVYNQFTHDPENPESLPTNEIVNVTIDQENMLWVATTKGLARLNESKKDFTVYKHDFEKPQNSLVDNYLFDILTDRNGAVWVSSSKGVSLITKTNDGYRFKNYLDNLPSTSVWRIEEAADGSIWMGFIRGGFGRFDPLTERCTLFPPIEGLDEQFPNGFFQDSHGRLWMPQYTSGLVCQDIHSGERQVYQHITCDLKSLPNDAIGCILPTKSGRWWVGHGKGLSFFYPYRDFFQTVIVAEDTASPTPLTPNGISVKMGDISYIATSEGLLKWNEATDEMKNVFDPKIIRQQNSDRYAANMLIDSRRRLWLGTSSGGPVYWSLADGSTRAFSAVMGRITNIVEDKGGNIWFSVDGNGLWLWENGQDTLQSFTPKAITKGRQVIRFIAMKLAPDGEGLWLGGVERGLLYFDIKSRSFTRQFQPNKGAGSSIVIDLSLEKNGSLWLATNKGLFHFNPKSEIFTSYFTQNGLRTNNLRSVKVDDSGNIWMGTEKGISYFNPKTKLFRNFSTNDGVLDGSYFQRGIRLQDGKLYFLSSTGLTIFMPEDLPALPPAPPVSLTGFNVLNEPHSLKSSPERTRDIYIKHDDYAFTFYYAALTAHAPKDVRYSYQMVGLNDAWNDVGTNNFVSFTALPPGNYTFRVQAIPVTGQQAGEPMEVKLHIKPAFWQTTAFKMLMGLLALGLLLAFIWLGKQQLDARHQAELAQQSATYKSQFLANMSHEIRTPLHAVLGAADLMGRSDLNQSQHHYLRHIQRSGKHLMGLLDDILDFSKIEANKLDFHSQQFSLIEVIEYVKETISHKLDSSETKMEVSLEDGIVDKLTGDPVRLGQILINLLNNAVQFAPKGNVALRVWEEKHEGDAINFGFEVSDDGVGIPSEEVNHIFDSFHQADNRHGLADSGFGLGLAITKALVNQQGGTIDVKSNEQQGTVFTFFLPFSEGIQAESQRSKIGANGSRNMQPLRRILMVEDMAVNRELSADMLQQAYPEAVIDLAKEGQEALDILQKGPLPDLILMDIRMPGMDGLTCTRLIRERHGGLLPILALSASATREEREGYLRTGLDGLLAKPFSPDQLVDRINTLMLMPDAADLEVDLDGLNHYLGQDEKRVERYLDTAGAEMLKHFDILRISLAEDRWKEAQVAAHSLKTTFLYLGITPLQDLGAELDKATREARSEAFIQWAPDMARYLRALFYVGNFQESTLKI